MRPHAKNPIIANVFAQTSLVEELGSGTRKIFKYTPIYAHGKQAEIIYADIFKIIIPHDDVVAMTTPQKTTQKIMQAMKENSGITIAELADICELSVDGIKYNLRVLTTDGLIKRVGGRKNGHWEVTESC